MVRAKGLLERPIGLRQPIIFYLGHLPAFAWNQIGRGVLGKGPMDEEFDELFERGIDPHEDDDVPQTAVWPEVEPIVRYRDLVRAGVREALNEIDHGSKTDELERHGRIVHLVIEHEVMHHETLVYLLHMLDEDLLREPEGWHELVLGERREDSEPIDIPAGPATLGARFDEIPFGWDNEFDSIREHVDPFQIESLPVTVGQYFEFVRAGGYADAACWEPKSFQWRERRGLEHPISWRCENGNWQVRSLFRWLPLEDVTGWPVHVSCAEAQAFAKAQGARLPSEAELHRAAYGTCEGRELPFPWGEAGPDTLEGLNAGFRRGAPVPVGSAPELQSSFGVHELVGNGWEWTSTPFAPFPGFQPWMRTYPGYSTDFFDDDHFVVFGGAWPTATKLLRRSLRNWYRRHYPYVFATFRLARS